MPENFREEDLVFLGEKSLQDLPGPVRDMIKNGNSGTILLDPDRFYEFEEFTPTSLVDHTGSATANDGVPYIEKYREGLIAWSPPNPRLHLDYGYFMYEDQKTDMSSVATKLVSKAKNYYYAPGKGFSDGRVPHEAGERDLAFRAMDRILAKYGDLPWEWVTADNEPLYKQADDRLLDQGVDTHVWGATRPIYSHHEEFNGSLKHAMHHIHEWQEAHDDHRDIKFIISPQLLEHEVMYDTYANMLRDRLDTLPEGASVKVVVSVHGMAWDRTPNEAWIELSPPYIDGNLQRLKAVLDGYDFSRTEIVQAQDHFADPINNPTGKYLSTNKAFWDGIEAGFDYIVNLPIEFFAENTDTMFSHAMYNFEDFDDFDRYETVDYRDWTVPFTRSYVQDGTEVIYNGVPVGAYSLPIIEALYLSLDDVLSQGLEPVEDWQRAAQTVVDDQKFELEGSAGRGDQAAVTPATAE